MVRLLQIYKQVTAHGCPNFGGARIQCPSNVVIRERVKIVHLVQNAQTVEFVQFCFPTGYKGPVPTPSLVSHPSINNHLTDVVVYVSKEQGKNSNVGVLL